MARHKREAEIAQARVIELTHRLETAQSSADTPATSRLHWKRSQGKLLDAESKIALLRPEVDALHRLLTEKEQEILLLKESSRPACSTVEVPASVVDASMPAIAKAGGDGSPDTGDARSDSELPPSSPLQLRQKTRAAPWGESGQTGWPRMA